MISLLPDTPRWYYSRRRNEEADAVLESLHNLLSLDSDAVQKQKQEILDTIAMESLHAKINVLDLLWDRSKLKTGRRLRVAFLILAIQQNMGIDVLVYFATTILKNVGLSPFHQQLLAAVHRIQPFVWGPGRCSGRSNGLVVVPFCSGLQSLVQALWLGSSTKLWPRNGHQSLS